MSERTKGGSLSVKARNDLSSFNWSLIFTIDVRNQPGENITMPQSKHPRLGGCLDLDKVRRLAALRGKLLVGSLRDFSSEF